MKYIVLFSILMATSLSFGADKSLEHRLGVGYSNQVGVGDVVGLPSIMAKYYTSKDLAFSGAVGISTGETNSAFGLLFKIYRVIFPEDSMLFYMGGGAGLVSNKVAGDNSSGFELMGVVGSEFFFPGLENLGFMFEAGIGVISLSSDVSFRTIGQSPINAGMVFYF